MSRDSHILHRPQELYATFCMEEVEEEAERQHKNVS